MFGTYFVLDVGEVFSTSTVMAHSEFLQSRFYKEWIQPQGWIDNIGVYLDRAPEGHAAFAVFRHEREGLADEPARERMRLLVPHLRRAVLIGKIIEFKTAQAATLADTLDGLIAGLLFVGFEWARYPRQYRGPCHDRRRRRFARIARPSHRQRSRRQLRAARHLSGCRRRRRGDWRQGRGRAAGRA